VAERRVVTGEGGALDAVRGEDDGHVSDSNEVAQRDKREEEKDAVAAAHRWNGSLGC